MSLFHRHKWGQEVTNGYQRCLKCGKAEPVACRHKWKCVHMIRPTWGAAACIDVLECTKCGERTERRYKA